jgi:hypothetical protein
MIREEREKRKELIPYDVATDIFRRGLDVILRRLKRFPQEKAPSCNPQNPLHALGILEAGLIPSFTKPRANTQPGLRKSLQPSTRMNSGAEKGSALHNRARGERRINPWITPSLSQRFR